MAMGNSGIMDFVQRFQSLRSQTDTSDELIQDLLVYAEGVESGLRQENSRLANQLNDAQLDLTDATKSRRELQQQLQKLEGLHATTVHDCQHLKKHNPYIVVLIDGDGLLFKDSFVKQGIDGGKAAAYALRAAMVQQCGDLAHEVEVIAKICANLSGLAKAYRRDAILETESELREFFQGFSQGKASFDFVDVGFGKERADTKIKETTKWNLRNHNCRQIILGISHDAGYAPFLDEILRDESTRKRITTIEGFPTVRELVATGVNILNLNDTLFRSDKLSERPAVRHASPPSSTALTPPQPLATSQSYAHVTGITSASPPIKITLPLQSKTANATVRPREVAKPAAPAWSPGIRGLDPPIQYSQSVLEGIRQRKDKDKLCNNHYLRGPCQKGESCTFEHRYKPTPEELHAIAFLTRLNPCKEAQACDIDDCIYGHHCPSVRDGMCQHPYCKFAANLHPPGTKLRNRNYESY